MALSIDALKGRFNNPGPAELELIARYAMLPDNIQRERAFLAFAETGLPHRRMEAWKWSDFKSAVKSVEAADAASREHPLLASNHPVIEFSSAGMKVPDVLPYGVKVHLREETRALANAEDVPLGAMTAALAGRAHGPDSVIIEVTEQTEAPLHIFTHGDRDETNFAHIMVVVRSGGSLDLVESHLGGSGFSSFLIEATVEDEASLRRTVLQHGERDEAQAITALINLGEKSEIRQTTLAFGAKLARLETRLTHRESHSLAMINGAYLCADGFHADFTSHVRHGAPSSVTRQLTKGAVMDGGTGVFQGKFLVPRTIGQHTDADMQHQALLLEDGAEVFAKPELEIYADDVECAHGNTSGALDQDQLFYLRQRGIPEVQAKALLTEAFIAEALDEASESVRDAMLDAAREFLAETV